MDKNIASAMLLRLNKQDQIEALKSIGFTTVNENTPASGIAKYMKWAGTLLDLSLATLRIEDGEQVFFTASEWNSMSANNRSKYIRIGIRLRAECHQFIIAKSDCVDAGGNKTFKWGGYGTDLRGLKNYGSGNQGLYDTFDGKENTDVIIETLAGVKDTRELSAPLPPKLPEPIKPVRLNLTELKIQPCGTCPHWVNLCLWPSIKPKSMSS